MFEYVDQPIQIEHKYFLGPCADVICTNSTDTCKYGVCQCGNVRGFTCDPSSELSQCFSGNCGCSKKAGTFEIGDGTTQGSCLSNNHRCQSSGRCLECISDGQCFGLSDKCRNNKCVCGEGPACDYDSATHICLMQRSSDEICELITDKYNPIYIPNNAVDAETLCDDNRGKF